MRMVESSIELPTYLQESIRRTAYMPPSLVPVKVHRNSNAGWKTLKKSIFLKNNHHDGKAPLDFLSVLGSIPFSIDKNMLKYDEKDTWGDLDSDSLKNKEREREGTIRVIKDMLKRGNKFYFIHRADARYRTYAAGYQLSPQGSDYKKALLNLHKEEILVNEYNF
jgi:hypothetical protein